MFKKKDKALKESAELHFIRRESSRVKVLMGRYLNGKLDREIEQVYDELHASPTQSHVTALGTENLITGKISELERALTEEREEDAKKTLAELLRLIAERNEAVKNSY